jgi:hypothetical protein
VLLVMVGIAAVGCGSAEPARTESPSPDRPLSSVPPPTMTMPMTPPSTPSDRLGLVKATGVLERGRSEGCVELSTRGGRYVLLGVSFGDWVPGDTVKVTGRLAPNALSMCDGAVLRVTKITRGEG